MTPQKKKSKKSISDIDGDTENDDDDEVPEESEEDELTPVKKQPAVFKLRGHQHKPLSPAGNCDTTQPGLVKSSHSGTVP